MIKLKLKPSLFFILILIIFYYLIAIMGLRYYLSEIIFKSIPETKTQEDFRYSVQQGDNSLLVRLYGKAENARCLIFFPGQHGGIASYEESIIHPMTQNNIAVYALSYPGYEGALGKANYQSVQQLSLDALKLIQDKTACKIENSIYFGRSLGAILALISAEQLTPKAMILDSLALSLADVIRNKLSQSFMTQSINWLPFEKILAFNPQTKYLLSQIKPIPMVVFQGEKDQLTPFDQIAPVLREFNPITLIKVTDATHQSMPEMLGKNYVNWVLKWEKP